MASLSPRAVRLAIFSAMLMAACNGSINCGGCIPGGLAPINFDPAARLDRAMELRITQSGLDLIGTEFGNLVGAYASMKCGPGENVPCPTDFRVGGQARPTSCDAMENTCLNAMGMSEPVLGFEIENDTQSGATVCRDTPGSPGARTCFAWLRLEGLRLRPIASQQVEATVSAQIYTTDIPIRYDALGMDCLVKLDSNASGSAQQDFVILAEIRQWMPPASGEGRQLEITIVDVMGNIPNGDISISRDPVHGGADDFLTCGLANIGPIKTALVNRLVGSLSAIIDDEVRDVIGWRCNVPNSTPCPQATHCNSDDRCEGDANGIVVPQRLGTDGRIDFGNLLAGIGSPTAGQGDIGFLVGGSSGSDATGLHIGVLGGFETAERDPRCSTPSQSPRLRPGAEMPRPFPADSMVDLDFDGTPERSFMLGAGVSQPILDQMLWTAYQSGVFCASVSSYETELLNTGAFTVLMPSIQKLTHSDKYRWSIWPARIGIRPGGEPRIVIGEGKTSGTPPNLALESPLLTVTLPNLELSFSAMIEERWVHLMTATVDVSIPVGAYPDPSGEVYFLLGDLQGGLGVPRVTNYEILGESQADLEGAIPALLSIVLPQLTGQLLAPFPLPAAADLGGFELNLLGIRGVPNGTGGFGHLGLYIDLGFDPAAVPNLSLAAETEAEIARVDLPTSAEMAVTHEGGPVLPSIELLLAAHAPQGAEVEHQLRIDGGLWSPFVRTERLTLQRPEMLLQGRHQIEVRSRIAGDPMSLDPTPVKLSVVIDSEPPQLDVRISPNGDGAFVRAFDFVSRDRVAIDVVADGFPRTVTPDENNFVALPELAENGALEVRATDENGRSSVVTLRSASALVSRSSVPEARGGCRCVDRSQSSLASILMIALSLLALRRRSR